MEDRGGFRAEVWLPVGALAAGIAMVALAVMALDAVRSRYELVLDGRVLGLAHRVETVLRDRGIQNAREALEPLLEDAGPEIRGIVLRDSAGKPVARLGDIDGTLRSRTVDLALGPRGFGGPPSPAERRQRLRQLQAETASTEPGPAGPGWGRGVEPRNGSPAERRGRGRFQMEVFLDRNAGRPPLASRLVLPAAVVGSVFLVILSLIAGRLLDRQRAMIRQEARERRLEAMGRAGAGLAHQLRTPLATIKGSLQMIAETAQGETLQRRARAAVGQAERMERMLGLLLDFARPPAPEAEDVDVATLLEELAAGRDGVRVQAPGTLVVRADREHMLQILENLLDNALAASPEGGPVEISAAASRRHARIIVADRGPGPGDNPEELFEPYVTGRAEGTGLGLPIARNLAEANGGTLELRARVSGGTEAILELPLAGGER